MQKILKSILETEREAEKIIADAKGAAQKLSQETGAVLEKLKVQQEKAIRENVEAALARVRQEALRTKEKILADALAQTQVLEKQAQGAMSGAVTVVLDKLLQTT